MPAGRQGPVHRFDVEQLWTVLDGRATLEIGDETVELTSGDTAVLPAGALRRLTTGDEGLQAIVTGASGAPALLADGTDRGVPPWIA